MLLLCCVPACGHTEATPLPRPGQLQEIESIELGNRTNVSLVEVGGRKYVVVHRSWSEAGVAIVPHGSPEER